MQLKLAADNSALWAVYSPGAGTDIINVKQYAEDADSTADTPPMIWTTLAGSPGDTDGGVNNPYSIFLSGGELYTVFRDASAGDTDFVSMKYYHDSATGDLPSFAWTQIGAAKFNTISDGAITDLTAVPVGFTGDIYSAFLEGVNAKLYKNNAGIDLSASDITIANADNMKLVSHNNNLYVGYEYTDGLYLRQFNSSFETLNVGGLVSSSAVEDGNAVFISGGGSIYTVFITDAGTFNAMKLEGETWSALTNTSGIPVTGPGAGYGTLAARWFNNHLYVFYINSADNKGWVKYYTEDEGWQSAEKNGTAITGSVGLSGFQLASSLNILYAGYIENSKACVRILE